MPSLANGKQDLASAAEQVKKNGKRLAIRRKGRVIAALVPADDLELLEEMDRRDLLAARRAVAQAKSRGEKPIPWEQVRKQLKL
jgi:PHD/YefM family antitoxin component YafN of YafNO toxin-antitoxin module